MCRPRMTTHKQRLLRRHWDDYMRAHSERCTTFTDFNVRWYRVPEDIYTLPQQQADLDERQQLVRRATMHIRNWYRKSDGVWAP
ncbi:hypothetical protein K438DRAFT_1823742 [Mycena galopus ATCC 62051]|nr:hypothetical protein K438DRAFT_1823742 [Mycena galopus ATCC 62051]